MAASGFFGGEKHNICTVFSGGDGVLPRAAAGSCSFSGMSSFSPSYLKIKQTNNEHESGKWKRTKLLPTWIDYSFFSIKKHFQLLLDKVFSFSQRSQKLNGLLHRSLRKARNLWPTPLAWFYRPHSAPLEPTLLSKKLLRSHRCSKQPGSPSRHLCPNWHPPTG